MNRFLRNEKGGWNGFLRNEKGGWNGFLRNEKRGWNGFLRNEKGGWNGFLRNGKKETLKTTQNTSHSPLSIHHSPFTIHHYPLTINHSPLSINHSPFIIILSALLLLSGCVKHTQLLYFRNQSEFVPLQNHDINNTVRIKIQTDDVLFILVRALDQETAEPFNLFGGANMQMMNMGGQNPSLQGYLVDPNGNIEIPVIGTLSVAGLTIEETKALIADKLKPYLTDPTIMIRFMNFRFTVLGEVGAPRTINVPGERMTILEAIGQAGDLTPYSNREKIMVIREQNGKREFGYVDIHSPDIFQSPYFYLQQNDIVYVEPIKEATAVVRDPIAETLPIISGILSIAALIIAFAR